MQTKTINKRKFIEQLKLTVEGSTLYANGEANGYKEKNVMETIPKI